MALLIIMKVVPLVVVGLALLVAVRAQDEESQESKDAAEAKEPKASAAPSKLAPTVSYAGLHRCGARPPATIARHPLAGGRIPG